MATPVKPEDLALTSALIHAVLKDPAAAQDTFTKLEALKASHDERLAAAIEAEKAARLAREQSDDARSRANEAQAQLTKDKAAFEALRTQTQAKLEADSTRLEEREQIVKRREGALPVRETAVASREAVIKEAQDTAARIRAEGEAMKREYEVRLEKLRALAGGAVT